MSGGEKNVGYVEKEGTRIVYDSSGMFPIQIRQFRPNAKIGDPVNAYDIEYDDYYNVINISYVNGPLFVTNLDIRVPEKPTIDSITNTSVTGRCVGSVVKNGDIAKVIDFNNKKVLGTGTITGTNFSVSISLSNYKVGDIIQICVTCENEKVKFHGTSEVSNIQYYTKV